MTTTSIPSQASADSAMPPIFLTVDQVAKRLNVGRSTAYNMINAGEIKHLRFGRLIRVSLSDLNEYLSSKLQANLQINK
jgi:excisionase family DNA binding protein